MKITINKYYSDRLIELLHRNNIDIIFITPSELLKYLTGIDVLFFEKFQGLFITGKGEIFYIVSKLNASQIKMVIGNEADIFVYEFSHMEAVNAAFDKFKLHEAVMAVDIYCRAIDMIKPINELRIKLYDGRAMLEEMTVIKSDYDIEILTIAAEKTDTVYDMVLNYIKPGMSERHIKNKIKDFFSQLGVVESVNVMAGFGKNTAIPHYTGENGVLQSVDTVLLDFGCKYRGFHSNTCRTFYTGKVSLKQTEVYDIVLRASLESELTGRAGMSAGDVDMTIREVISKAGYGQMLFYGLGQGIGCCPREAPYINKDSKRIIENGMVFSIEPRLYFEGEFGVKIKNIVSVKNDKLVSLNKSSRNLIVL